MSKSKVRVRYNVGDIFAVPLEDGGYATCLVARRHGPIFLGYFFGPRLSDVPLIEDVNFCRERLLLVDKCGDLNIIRGDWPKIGSIKPWDKAEWPIPLFRSTAYARGEEVAVSYSDNNLTEPVEIIRLNTADLEKLREDSLFGAAAMESYLTQLLRIESQLS